MAEVHITSTDARALRDAHDHTRRAAAALRALEPLTAAEVTRQHSQLADVQAELEHVQERAVMREGGPHAA